MRNDETRLYAKYESRAGSLLARLSIMSVCWLPGNLKAMTWLQEVQHAAGMKLYITH